MAARRDPVVLLPRFTTLVGGAAPFRTLPLEVRAYSGADVTVWRNALIGTSTSFQISFLESSDRDSWAPCDGGSASDPGEDEEVEYVLGFDKQWFRVEVQCLGTNPGVTCWAQGYLLRREQ